MSKTADKPGWLDREQEGLARVRSALTWIYLPKSLAYVRARFRVARRQAQQGALLWGFAVAAERNLPLAPMLDAFDMPGWWQARVRALSALLETGTPLPEALEAVPGVLPPQAVTTAQVGAVSGALGPALRQAAEQWSNEQESWLRHSTGGVLIYLSTLVLVLTLIAGFIIYWIVPKFRAIFQDFGTELPQLTQLVIGSSDLVVGYWPLFALPAFILLAILLIQCTEWYLGESRAGGPWRWMSHQFPRLELPGVLRNLRIPVEAGQPLEPAVLVLATRHPSRAVRRRLSEVHQTLLHGGDCWQSLHQVGLLRQSEAAVLESAQRLGNLGWALEDMARRITHRADYRLSLVITVVRPLMILMFGLVVGLFVIAMFLPLVKLIFDLS